MVLASANPFKLEKTRDDIELPIIDLNSNRSQASKLIVKACEEYGFFKVINHGVPQQVITRMEEQTDEFFSKPASEKLRAGPANPIGYGCKDIGLNGDVGEVEYLLLQTSPHSISHNSKFIATDPNKFSFEVSDYVEAVRELACQILDLMEEGLGGYRVSAMKELVRDVESDSLLRLNHYPAIDINTVSHQNIGFGEHTDPQILTLLRSNGVGGLQISLENAVWLPVSPYPESSFCVNVGDMLQVMTNGRFTSVKHRAVVNPYKSRTSMAFFAAPPLQATISCLATLENPRPMYRSFTWAEYKNATYTRKLGDNRLNLFKHRFDDKIN